jgi:hypothetical protein
MSALGHKRTFAVQKGMSALLPKRTLALHKSMAAKGQKRTLMQWAFVAGRILPVRHF